MEKWKEIFKNKIPNDIYNVKLSNGEKDGLLIILYNSKRNVKIYFGAVRAVRMLDEGIVMNGTYSENELKRFKKNNFSNVIYEIKNGDFGNQISMMAGQYYFALNLKHYVIITMNFDIDVITEWEPEIEIVEN